MERLEPFLMGCAIALAVAFAYILRRQCKSWQIFFECCLVLLVAYVLSNLRHIIFHSVDSLAVYPIIDTLCFFYLIRKIGGISTKTIALFLLSMIFVLMIMLHLAFWGPRFWDSTYPHADTVYFYLFTLEIFCWVQVVIVLFIGGWHVGCSYFTGLCYRGSRLIAGLSRVHL